MVSCTFGDFSFTYKDKGLRMALIDPFMTSHAFHQMSWRQFDCAFGPYNNLWWPANGQISGLSLLDKFGTYLASAKDGRLVLGGNPSQEPDICCSWQPAPLRHAPIKSKSAFFACTTFHGSRQCNAYRTGIDWRRNLRIKRYLSHSTVAVYGFGVYFQFSRSFHPDFERLTSILCHLPPIFLILSYCLCVLIVSDNNGFDCESCGESPLQTSTSYFATV